MEVGLWAEALNLVVRRFCGSDCTEMVQWRIAWAREWMQREIARAQRKKETRFAEANRVCGSYEISCDA